jgi:hypothetical protein
MPRASWRGFLRLSVVTCPVYLSPATTRTKPIRLPQVWQPAPVDVNEDELPDRHHQHRGCRQRMAALMRTRVGPSLGSRFGRMIPEPARRSTTRGRERIRIRSRPIRHVLPRGIEGARRRKLKGDRSRKVCAAERSGSSLFRQLVLPLSRRPDRGRNAAGDRRGNGPSWGRRIRAAYAKPARADGRRRAARRRDGVFHFACRKGRSGGAVWHGRGRARRRDGPRSPRRSSRSGPGLSIRRRIEIVTRRPCSSLSRLR